MKKEKVKNEQVEDIKNFIRFKNNKQNEFAPSKTPARYIGEFKMMQGFR